jgi:hypothetical protein
VIFALALCGTGLGLGFPGLTTAALRSRGTAAARAAKTVAARDFGLVLGLLVLTPVFVNQVNSNTASAESLATGYVVIAPLPLSTKQDLGQKLIAAVNSAPLSRPPDIAPVFDEFRSQAPASEQAALSTLQRQLQSIIDKAATHAFRRPLLYGAIFALAVLPLLAVGSWLARSRRAIRRDD